MEARPNARREKTLQMVQSVSRDLTSVREKRKVSEQASQIISACELRVLEVRSVSSTSKSSAAALPAADHTQSSTSSPTGAIDLRGLEEKRVLEEGEAGKAADWAEAGCSSGRPRAGREDRWSSGAAATSEGE